MTHLSLTTSLPGSEDALTLNDGVSESTEFILHAHIESESSADEDEEMTKEDEEDEDVGAKRYNIALALIAFLPNFGPHFLSDC